MVNLLLKTRENIWVVGGWHILYVDMLLSTTHLFVNFQPYLRFSFFNYYDGLSQFWFTLYNHASWISALGFCGIFCWWYNNLSVAMSTTSENIFYDVRVFELSIKIWVSAL